MTAGLILSFLVRSAGLCLFPLLAIFLGIVALVALPQGVEILRTITGAALLHPLTQSDDFARALAFFGSLKLWSLASWYAARLVLQRDFGDDPFIPQSHNPRFETAFREWFPRALIPLGILPIAARLASLGELVPAVVALVIAIALTALVIARRWLLGFVPVRTSAVRVAPAGAGNRRFDLPEGEELALWLAIAFAAVLFTGLWLVNYELARWLGAAAILLLSLASVTLLGSTLLVYVPKINGWPPMTGAAILLAAILGLAGATANHGIAARRVDADAETRVVRPTAAVQFDRWSRAIPPRADCPPTICGPDGLVVLVASEGGASRSAWWSAHVLGVLDDLTEGRFGDQSFAASGISGGSLGVATWVALRRDTRDAAFRSTAAPSAAYPADADCEPESVRAEPSAARRSACFLGGDFVSTTLGYLTGVDLLQRFVPAPVASWDRSRGLEVTWARDWRVLFRSDALARPLLELYMHSAPPAVGPDAPLRADIPALLLNTSTVDRGRPAVQAPIRVSDAEVDDLLDPALRTAGLTLAGAVHNSARFPYVSPGGDVVTADGAHFDTVVDGGYIENSGALALAALMRSIPDEHWRRDLRERLIVLFIANDPDEPRRGGAELCSPASLALDLHDQPAWGEATTPLVGLFNARASRADTARRALLRELGLCTLGNPEQHVYFVSMASPMVREVRPAMSWYMTARSRETMWRAVATEPARSQVLALATRFGNDPVAIASRLAAYGR